MISLIHKRIKHIGKNQSGLTLVEVMVSFVILLIALAGLTQTTSMSIKLVSKARQIQQGVDKVSSFYYSNGDKNDGNAVDKMTNKSLNDTKIIIDTKEYLIEGTQYNTYIHQEDDRSYTVYEIKK